MDKRLKCFFETLIKQYGNREDINHIHYDGETEPVQVKKVPSIKELSKHSNVDLPKWLADYLSKQDKISYYQMYKQLINEYYNIWVNPTLEEFNPGSKKRKLLPQSYLKSNESFERLWAEKLHKKLFFELETSGYSVVSGSELIDYLVRSYDRDPPKNISIVDWIKPTDVSLLENDQSYIVDRDVFTKPILLTKLHLMERDNLDLPISESLLDLYFQSILVTRRGLESEELEEDSKIEFYFYKDMENYLECHKQEKKVTTLRKLFNDGVDSTKPFIEAVVDDYGEVYINNHLINTEKDILDFVNMAYILEEVDREAKSFNRNKILEKLLCKDPAQNTNISFMWKNSIH